MDIDYALNIQSAKLGAVRGDTHVGPNKQFKLEDQRQKLINTFIQADADKKPVVPNIDFNIAEFL